MKLFALFSKRVYHKWNPSDYPLSHICLLEVLWKYQLGLWLHGTLSLKVFILLVLCLWN